MAAHPELDSGDQYAEAGPEAWWTDALCGDVAAMLRSGAGDVLGNKTRLALAEAVGEGCGTDYLERALALVAVMARAQTSDGMVAACVAAKRLVHALGVDAALSEPGRAWIAAQEARVAEVEREARARYAAQCRLSFDYRGGTREPQFEVPGVVHG